MMKVTVTKGSQVLPPESLKQDIASSKNPAIQDDPFSRLMQQFADAQSSIDTYGKASSINQNLHMKSILDLHVDTETQQKTAHAVSARVSSQKSTVKDTGSLQAAQENSEITSLDVPSLLAALPIRMTQLPQAIQTKDSSDLASRAGLESVVETSNLVEAESVELVQRATPNAGSNNPNPVNTQVAQTKDIGRFKEAASTELHSEEEQPIDTQITIEILKNPVSLSRPQVSMPFHISMKRDAQSQGNPELMTTDESIPDQSSVSPSANRQQTAPFSKDSPSSSLPSQVKTIERSGHENTHNDASPNAPKSPAVFLAAASTDATNPTQLNSSQSQIQPVVAGMVANAQQNMSKASPEIDAKARTIESVTGLNPIQGKSSIEAGQAAQKAQRPNQAAQIQILQQIKDALKKPMTPGESHMKITLNPRELGTVDIRLDISDKGKVSAQFNTSNREALEILSSYRHEFTQIFENSGLTMDNGGLNFTTRDDGRSQGDPQQPEHPSPTHPVETKTFETASAGHLQPYTSTHAVDVRA